MIPRLVTLIGALMVPGFAGMVDDRPERLFAEGSRWLLAEADTILRRDLSLPPPTVDAGLVPDPDEPYVTLGLRRIRLSEAGVIRPLEAPASRGLVGPLVLDPITTVVLRDRVATFGRSGMELVLPPAERATQLPPAGGTNDRFVTEFIGLAGLKARLHAAAG